MTSWMSFFLIAASRVSSGFEYRDSVGEMGSTYARSAYLAVMNFSRCSLVDCDVGFCEGSSLASHVIFDTRFPTRRRSSTMSVVKEVMSSVRDRTLLM